jgi:hypothetical protein
MYIGNVRCNYFCTLCQVEVFLLQHLRFRETQDPECSGQRPDGFLPDSRGVQVPILPKVTNICECTFYIFVTLNQYSLVGQVFLQSF